MLPAGYESDEEEHKEQQQEKQQQQQEQQHNNPVPARDEEKTEAVENQKADEENLKMQAEDDLLQELNSDVLNSHEIMLEILESKQTQPQSLSDQIDRLIRLADSGEEAKDHIEESRDFCNPYLLQKMLDHLVIDGFSSNLSNEVFCPDRVRARTAGHYENLAKQQEVFMGTKQAANPPAANPEEANKKKSRRWDATSSDVREKKSRWA